MTEKNTENLTLDEKLLQLAKEAAGKKRIQRTRMKLRCQKRTF